MSELRQDLVSGDWIILATERAKRPHELLPKKARRKPTPVSKCPFEDLQKSGNWPPILTFPASAAYSAEVALAAKAGKAKAGKPNEKKWRVAVIQNKYPALRHENDCAFPFKTGPYEKMDGAGHHDLVITRNHFKNLAHLSGKEALEVFEVLRERYLELKKDECHFYTLTFVNWGESAGASLYHPHFQILTLPIIPPHVNRSLNGSAAYFKKHHRCVHCEIIDFEKNDKKRIIFENGGAFAVAPFASSEPFQVKIFPKKHTPYFEKTPVSEMKHIVSALQIVLAKIEKNLKDPDFNFFIHTAPLKNQGKYAHYHWHIEVLPKISTMAGFELGTGVDINVVDPDTAAKILKK